MSERITHTHVRDVTLSIGTLALLTLDNGAGPRKPNTLGPEGLAELRAALQSLRDRAEAGEIVAAAVTGKPFHFAAGADLHGANAISTPEQARTIAESGHDTYRILLDFPAPTFAFIGGVALGGGMELALSCDYRTVTTSVRNLGLPEVALGLIPGWGGTFLAPHTIGIEAAVQVVVANPLRNNTHLRADQAGEIGLVDAVLEPADFVAQSLHWAERVIRGEITVTRPTPAPATRWHAVVDAARTQVDSRLHGAAPAPYRALDLLDLAAAGDRERSFAAEDDALTELILSPEFTASMHAFELTTRRVKQPTGAPPADRARPVTSVGIAGAGLMASQLALLFARRMKVPVLMRDLTPELAERGLALVAEQVATLERAGRISSDEAHRIRSAITVSTDIADFSGCDLVIEAVFEEMAVKQAVFSELEAVVDPETILATNTSALSVSTMASVLQHPERVVGLHFFNPVAQMPLVEIIRGAATDDQAFATAFAVAAASGKSPIAVGDRPGFVVNRLLVRMLGEVLGTLEDGTSVADADAGVWPLGLPMGPFQLLQLVGPAVAKHVLDTLRDNLGDRFPTSPGLDRMVREGARFVDFDDRPSATSPIRADLGDYFGSRAPSGSPSGSTSSSISGSISGSPSGTPSAQTPEQVTARIQQALAQEVRLMLEEGVVADPADIDLAMILGAGWPFHLGGITPYLRRTGALEMSR